MANFYWTCHILLYSNIWTNLDKENDKYNVFNTFTVFLITENYWIPISKKETEGN